MSVRERAGAKFMPNITKARSSMDGFGVVWEHSSTSSPTKPEVEFVIAIEHLLYRISSSFVDPEQRSELIKKIVDLINERLSGIQFDQNYEQITRSVQIPVLLEAAKIRTAYLSSFLSYARLFPLIIGLVLLAIWLLLTIKEQSIYITMSPIDKNSVGNVVNIIGAAGFTLIGLIIGVALSIYSTNSHLTIDNFDNIQRYGLPITTYFGFLYALCAVVLLLLIFNVVVLGVGSVTLNPVLSEPYLGLLIGLLCGISKSLVVPMVVQIVRPSLARSSQ